MKVTKIIGSILILTIYIKPAYALQSAGALGMKLGTQGIGIEGRTPITHNIFARMGLNYLSLNKKDEDGAISLTLLSVPLMLDLHPFNESGFRLSLGLAYNGNKIKAKTTKVDNEVGLVTGKLKLGNEFAGIASIGYDSSFKNYSHWSFNCEAGVMYTGDPKLSISTTIDDSGRLERNMQRQLNKQKKNLIIFLIFILD